MRDHNETIRENSCSHDRARRRVRSRIRLTNDDDDGGDDVRTTIDDDSLLS